MEMNNPRVESHVAQQSRRHKLRFQQNSDDPTHHNFDHLHRPKYGSISYDPNVFPSEMLNSIASNPHLLLPLNHAFVSHDQDSGHGSDSSPPDRPMITNNNTSTVVSFPNYPQSSCNWKTVVNSQQIHVSSDWNVVNYSNAASMSIDQSNSNSPMMVSGGEGSSKPAPAPGCYGYHQDLHSIQLGDQKNYGEVPAFGPSQFYQNTLQEVVSSATLAVRDHRNKNDSEINHSIPCWMNASDHQMGFMGSNNRTHDHRDQETPLIMANNNTQGLSLSLSSIPRAKDDYPNLESSPKGLKSDLFANSEAKSSMGISSFAHRNSSGPLGPFTGYATILKNSKYLKPAQELLNDNCDVGGQELAQTCHDIYSQKMLEEEMSRVSGDSGASSSMLYGSNDHMTGRSSSGAESFRPEFHQKKAKLLYMQEEVCRRYKQYHQQMQMVISSFETVAGLSAATPYVSLALKAVSRHFHFVKNAISEQLTQMMKTLGGDLCSPTTGTSSSKGFDGNSTSSSSRLKSMADNNNFQRHGKSGSGAAGFFGPQQPVWRPQRGLPERAVSILKAWLFDHFLHPYPSDADKHMLATQTGLTRNQVSNWFINARVRIWKPMVEEIHTLETKGLSESNTNIGPSETRGQDNTSRVDVVGSSLNMRPQPECSRNLAVGDEANEPLWDHEKRLSRAEYQAVDRSFMSMVPYPRSAFEGGGMVPVSLTLGLRQNGEHVQQLQQQEHQLRQHFGGQLIHDFVG